MLGDVLDKSTEELVPIRDQMSLKIESPVGQTSKSKDDDVSSLMDFVPHDRVRMLTELEEFLGYN